MDYRTLGRTGVRVSSLCMGCWMFGNRIDRSGALSLVSQARDAGVNFFDTANVYPATAEARGDSERLLGEALRGSGQRERTLIASKVAMDMTPDDPNGRGVSRRHIIEQCEGSLRRLGTDWIDLYYLHRPPTDVPVDESLRALDDLVRSGKVRYIGTSHSSAWAFVESLWIAKELGLNRFIAEQPPYNLLDRRIENELVPMAQTFGVAINSYMPLGGGLLTGLYQRGKPPPSGSRHADPSYGGNPLFAKRLTDAVYDVNAVLAELARERSCSIASLAFNWVLAQPSITSAISGPESAAEMADILSAIERPLDADALQRLDQIMPPGTAVSPFYEPDRSPHVHRVP